MIVDQLKGVENVLLKSGHKDSSKTVRDDGTFRLKPTKETDNPAAFACFSDPKTAAPMSLMPARRDDKR